MLPILFGLLAAFLFAASASLQQHAAHRTVAAGPTQPAPDSGRLATRALLRPLLAVLRPLLALVRRLVRTPLWLFGWVTNLVGFLVQAAALHFGSVALVQPLLVTQLLFAIPMAAGWLRRWPDRLEWVGGAAITGGVVVFLAVRGVVPTDGRPDRPRVVVAGLLALVAVGILVAVAAGRPPRAHATLIAVAAGLCFAVSAVLIKLTTDDLVHHGVAATAVDWPGYSLAISTLLGLLLEQGAFAVGSLSAAVAAMTITNPLASYLVGVLAFHVMPPTSPGALAALAGSGALLVCGVMVLSQPGVGTPDRGNTDSDVTEPGATQHSA